MSIQETIGRLRPLWHARAPLDSFAAIDAIERAYRCRLPADYKYFLQWFSDGGEGRLPRGDLALYRAEDLLRIQELYDVRAMGELLVFASDGDEAFAFDLTRRRDTSRYPVVTYSFAARDPSTLEDVGEDFRSFLEGRLRDP
jgi:hypothetical protein